MSDNLQMARQGSSFTEGDVSLAWGMGASAVHDVVEIPEPLRSGRLRARIVAGFIEETDRPVTGGGMPPIVATGLLIELSEIPGNGQGVVFNSETHLFDPAPRVQNITSIDLPDNATAADVAAAFNDLRVVLIEAQIMDPDPS